MNLKMPTEAELAQIQKGFGETEISHFVMRVDVSSPRLMVTAWDHQGAMIHLGISREDGSIYKVDLTGEPPKTYPVVPPQWERLE